MRAALASYFYSVKDPRVGRHFCMHFMVANNLVIVMSARQHVKSVLNNGRHSVWLLSKGVKKPKTTNVTLHLHSNTVL